MNETTVDTLFVLDLGRSTDPDGQSPHYTWCLCDEAKAKPSLASVDLTEVDAAAVYNQTIDNVPGGMAASRHLLSVQRHGTHHQMSNDGVRGWPLIAASF